MVGEACLAKASASGLKVASEREKEGGREGGRPTPVAVGACLV